jgi:hypothetical protein
MSNPAKAKGSQWERDVVAYMRSNGLPYMERRFGAGQQKDKGDLVGDPGFVYECKNHKAYQISVWLGEAEVERDNAGAHTGIVIAKRPRVGIENAVVMMTLKQYMEMRETLKKTTS